MVSASGAQALEGSHPLEQLDDAWRTVRRVERAVHGLDGDRDPPTLAERSEPVERDVACSVPRAHPDVEACRGFGDDIRR